LLGRYRADNSGLPKLNSSANSDRATEKKMQIATDISSSRATLKLNGRFDFHSHRDFRSAYEAALEKAGVRELVIDFNDVDYLDSSALGMLLLLREKAEAVNKAVALAGLQGMVKQVLEIANFGKLFSVNG
jgi:HptB-dependent secretion and biofilm anti anti-sigma factor